MESARPTRCRVGHVCVGSCCRSHNPELCFSLPWQQHARPRSLGAWWVLPQEARALRYLHAAAPGGTAPGVVRLLDCFTLGAHYCLVTGGCCVFGERGDALQSGCAPGTALHNCPLSCCMRCRPLWAAERLFPWLLDWIADSSALPPQQGLHQLRKVAHQLLVGAGPAASCWAGSRRSCSDSWLPVPTTAVDRSALQ